MSITPPDILTTWATVDDLYDRYGEEFVDKLSIRRNYDSSIGSYVADESPEGKFRVQMLALEDAKNLIITKLSCKFSGVALLNDFYFAAIKQWHIKLTIETLKIGGDCWACECNTHLDSFIDCGSICSEDGQCLVSKKTFISASVAHFPCECLGSCGCC